jgi:hypothetical protein
MRKRISLMITAVILVLTVALGGAASAFADTNNLCQSHPNHKQCITTGPGKSLDSKGAAAEHNPNVKHVRDH